MYYYSQRSQLLEVAFAQAERLSKWTNLSRRVYNDYSIMVACTAYHILSSLLLCLLVR
ncbi:hypothetical protein EC55P2_00048 [Enterococcus phage EC55P2]|nr:hypothetical protein EC55P2_00048 [Enterococcus phage EC55P2]